MRKHRHGGLGAIIAASVACCCLAAGRADADVVHLEDGSRVVGTIQQLIDGQLMIETAFAGELTIEAALVRGIEADRKLVLALPSGDRLVGIPRYSPEEGQRITETSIGEVKLGAARFTGIWAPDQPAPADRAAREEIAEVQAEHRKEVERLRQRLAGFEDAWSGRIEIGLNGTTGNKERLSLRGRAEARREVELERLLLFTEGSFSEEDNERTENEILAGARLERDISDRWFVFGKTGLEFDEFENLDLRTTLSAGLGYFFIREERHELKGRLGAGYQHESFDDDTTEDQGVLDIGYDYRLDVNEWLRLTHALTYYPTFDDPSGDYRLRAETASEVPLSREEAWKLRLGMRNDYDAMPRPGVERLDTTYFLNLVYDWD